MKIDLKFNGSVLPIKVNFILSNEGKVTYVSEYLGSTISTFPTNKQYEGKTMEESIELISFHLVKAIKELYEV